MNEHIVEDFYLLDVDRTILKSTTFVEAYVYPALVARYANSEHAQRMIEAVRAEERQNRGQAFDYLTVYAEYMKQHDHTQSLMYQQLGNEILQRVRSETGAIDASFVRDILVEGSIELIRLLAAKKFWGFLTTGGPQTQQLKLMIIAAIVTQELGIVPRGLVIASEQKAHMIETVWYDAARQLFRIPEELSDAHVAMYARQVTMIDDKPKNLHHEHKAIATYLAHAAEAPAATDNDHHLRQSLLEIAGHLR